MLSFNSFSLSCGNKITVTTILIQIGQIRAQNVQESSQYAASSQQTVFYLLFVQIPIFYKYFHLQSFHFLYRYKSFLKHSLRVGCVFFYTFFLSIMNPNICIHL